MCPRDVVPDGEVPDRLYVQAVEKAFRVLEAFGSATGPLSLSQLAAATGLDKSGAQRMGHTLARLGYLEQTPTGLRPGHRILERSFDYLRSEPLVRRAYPIVAGLRDETQERADLSRFDDLQILFLVRMPPSPPRARPSPPTSPPPACRVPARRGAGPCCPAFPARRWTTSCGAPTCPP